MCTKTYKNVFFKSADLTNTPKTFPKRVHIWIVVDFSEAPLGDFWWPRCPKGSEKCPESDPMPSRLPTGSEKTIWPAFLDKFDVFSTNFLFYLVVASVWLLLAPIGSYCLLLAPIGFYWLLLPPTVSYCLFAAPLVSYRLLLAPIAPLVS